MEDIKEFRLIADLKDMYWASDSFLQYLFKSVLRSFFMTVVVTLIFVGFFWSLYLLFDESYGKEVLCFVAFFEILLICCLVSSMKKYSTFIIRERLSNFASEKEIRSMVGRDARAIFHIDNFLKKVQEEEITQEGLLKKVIKDQLDTIKCEVHESSIKTVTKFEKIISDPVLLVLLSLTVAFGLSSISINIDSAKVILFVLALLCIMPMCFRFLRLFSECEMLPKKKLFLAYYLLRKIK